MRFLPLVPALFSSSLRFAHASLGIAAILASCYTSSQAVEMQPIRHSKLKIKAHLDDAQTLADIQSVAFYITRDNGATWTAVDPSDIRTPDVATNNVPYFIFTSAGDGRYGFWTQVRYLDGSGDRAPQAGTLPQRDAVKLIDTTLPSIDAFYAGLLTGTGTKLVIEWEVSDLHLSNTPVTIEYSSDLTTWTPFIHDQAAHASYIGSLPEDVRTCAMRLSVSDRAQNLQLSKIVHIGSAPAGDIEPAATADNSNSTLLPSLQEVSDAIDEELSATDTSDASDTSTPAPSTSATPPVVKKPSVKKYAIPDGYQDVIAPYADKPWPQTQAQDVHTNTETERDTAQSTVHPGSSSYRIPADIALILQQRQGRLIFGADAPAVLDAARRAVALGAAPHALVLYQRLHDSTVTAEALPEEIDLLIGLKRLDEALRVLKSAPPESMSTRIRVQKAEIFIAMKRTSEALAILHALIPSTDGRNSAAYKNSRLILARLYLAQNKAARALPILTDLSHEQDSWGASARTLLDSLHSTSE